MDETTRRATPRPWMVGEGRDAITIYAAMGKGRIRVAELAEQFTTSERDANASLIIRAVNAFEPLVKALLEIQHHRGPGGSGEEEAGHGACDCVQVSDCERAITVLIEDGIAAAGFPVTAPGAVSGPVVTISVTPADIAEAADELRRRGLMLARPVGAAVVATTEVP